MAIGPRLLRTTDILQDAMVNMMRSVQTGLAAVLGAAGRGVCGAAFGAAIALAVGATLPAAR